MARFPAGFKTHAAYRYTAFHAYPSHARSASRFVLRPIPRSQAPPQHRLILESVHLVQHRKRVSSESDGPPVSRSPNIFVTSRPRLPLGAGGDCRLPDNPHPMAIQETAESRHLIAVVKLLYVVANHAGEGHGDGVAVAIGVAAPVP